MRVGRESQCFCGSVRNSNHDYFWGYPSLAKMFLRNVDDQILSAKSEVRASPALHIFRGRLREGGNDNRQRNRGVAVHIGSQRAAAQFSVYQRFIKRDGTRPAAWVRRIGRNLNCVLVTVNLLFED